MLHGRILRSPLPHARGSRRSMSPPPRAIPASAPSWSSRGRTIRPPRSCATSARRSPPSPRFPRRPPRRRCASSASTTSRCPSSWTWTRRARPDAPPVYDAASAPAGHPSGFPAPRGLPLNGNVRGTGDRAAGATSAQGFAASRHRRRGRVPHPGADPLLPGAACDRRRLAGGRADRLHVHAVHRRRAPRAGGGVRPAAEPRARHRRRHGRRLRLQVVARQLRPHRRRAVAPGAGAGAPRPRSRGRADGLRATARRPGSACASARGATAR